MFFKDIETWSWKKIKWLWILFNSLYLIAMIVVPIITTCSVYGWFQTTEKITLFSGWSLFGLLLIGAIGLIVVNKVIRKLPDETTTERRIKYTIQMLEKMLLPIFLILLAWQFNLATQNATRFIIYASISWMVGIAIDGLFVKYLDKEFFYQQEINKKSAIEARSHRAKK